MDMSWSEQLRASLAKIGQRVTITAIVLKAIAIAQIKHPESRSVLLPFGRTAVLEEVVGGFTAEKVVEGKPVVYFGAIKEPIKKTIAQIARELREYAERDVSEIPQLDLEHRFAKMPWLIRRIILWFGVTFPDFRLKFMDATFGISSLGKYGIRMLIPPCVTTSTFGIGSVENRPVVRGGEIVIRPIMNISLNFDHRLIDGAPAARFLNDVRLLLEGGLHEHLTPEERAAVSQTQETTELINSLENAIADKKVSVG
jgi:pyruvate/2-oxoglutarate dehydrogenase complex dihydrolipoamide acyltransferase (E2) component